MKTNLRRAARGLPFVCGLAMPVCIVMPACAAPDEASLRAPQFAPQFIGFRGTLPKFKAVQVESSNVYDYTFAAAPADWRVQSGVWAMTDRWSSAPGWSWFGGRSEEIASIWNKRRFAGDFSVQFYFAFKMGMTGTRAWAERPADAAITVCGDGKNLGSGYSFVIGANDNQHSVLMKQGKVVAESTAPEALFPSYADGRPSRLIEGTRVVGVGAAAKTVIIPAYGQTHWWCAKVNKIGNRIECWLDDKLLFAYDDPEPLGAGQFALWTYHNGIMLSRVQIFYENEVRPESRFTRKVTAPVQPMQPAGEEPATIAKAVALTRR